jgi:hypothetical protein
MENNGVAVRSGWDTVCRGWRRSSQGQINQDSWPGTIMAIVVWRLGAPPSTPAEVFEGGRKRFLGVSRG